MRLVNRSGFVFQSFAPGPQKIRVHDHAAEDVQPVQAGQREVDREEVAVRGQSAVVELGGCTRST